MLEGSAWSDTNLLNMRIFRLESGENMMLLGMLRDQSRHKMTLLLASVY